MIFSRFNKLLSVFTTQSLKLNAISNFVGSAWTALIGIIFVPINLYYLGVEAYGVIGVFNSLQVFVWLFDFSLSAVIGREIPRLLTSPEKAQEMRDLTCTIERINWLMAILLSVFLFALSPLIAGYWLKSEQLPVETITQSFMILSVGFVFQWSLNFYISGISGLQRQSALNAVNVICSTIRSLGGVFVLAFVSPTLQAFLTWQVIINVVQIILLYAIFYRYLPSAPAPASFHWHLLGDKWGFAAGLTGISILGLILQQLDKVILSRMLSLEFFGYYALATSITSLGLAIIPRSVANAVYPRFTHLVKIGDEAQLRDLYHRSTQVISVLLVPAVAMLAVFPYEILTLWTRNAKIAENTWALLMVLALATAFNGFLHIPYFIQLAHGWTRIIIFSASIALLIITPTMIVSVSYYGAIAGAISWLLLNIFHLLFDVQIMHRYTLKGEQWQWYFIDTLKPFVVAFIITLLGKMILGTTDSKIKLLFILGITVIFSYLCTAFSTNFIRNRVWELLKTRGKYALQT